MRISTSMLYQNAMRSLRTTLSTLNRAQEQATSGRRVATVSDDPGDAAQIMRMDTNLREIEQFRRNMASASTRMSTEEVVLKTARELVARARDLAIGAQSADPADPQRQAALAEVGRIRDQLVSLGNTRIGTEYLFAGAKTTTAPFLADGSYLGDTIVRTAEIDEGVTLAVNHTGDQVFSAAFSAVDDLANELAVGTPGTIADTVAGLNATDQTLLAAQTEMGARLLEIRSTTDHLARRATNLVDRREQIRDVDPAEAILKVVSTQNALERAYAAIGRVLSTDFLQFLR